MFILIDVAVELEECVVVDEDAREKKTVSRPEEEAVTESVGEE